MRRILDAGGLREVTIVVSGNLDEHGVAMLVARGDPIDGFGIGTRLDTSADAPYLDCAYKLQEYAGVPRRKHSEGKTNWPGRRQVFRRYDGGATMTGDVVTVIATPSRELTPSLRQGRRVGAPPTATGAPTLARLATLPAGCRRLTALSRTSSRSHRRSRALAAESCAHAEAAGVERRGHDEGEESDTATAAFLRLRPGRPARRLASARHRAAGVQRPPPGYGAPRRKRALAAWPRLDRMDGALCGGIGQRDERIQRGVPRARSRARSAAPTRSGSGC